ncbi:hypothetical protein XA68_16087 [Ophiocordyceps unilateralis]|uniref:Uncharacterized protein n=1 Tax=Ophiocordyceps unilateralis TaxID=268505 RepID=A0A2A9PM20_OPHUN|nr:hypothetical protein XA68_16087 [Ophiocordyceps unilateralis]
MPPRLGCRNRSGGGCKHAASSANGGPPSDGVPVRAARIARCLGCPVATSFFRSPPFTDDAVPLMRHTHQGLEFCRNDEMQAFSFRTTDVLRCPLYSWRC